MKIFDTKVEKLLSCFFMIFLLVSRPTVSKSKMKKEHLNLSENQTNQQCFYGTIKDIRTWLNRNISEFSASCPKTQNFKDLITIAGLLGEIENLFYLGKFKTAEAADYTTKLAPLILNYPTLSFLGQLTPLVGLDKSNGKAAFNTVWDKLKALFSEEALKERSSFFFSQNLWRYVLYIRQVALLPTKDENACLSTSTLIYTQFEELIGDLNRERFIVQRIENSQFTLSNVELAKGGIAFAFWAVLDLNSIKNNANTNDIAFEGLLENNIVAQLKLVKGTGATVNEVWTLGDKTHTFVNTAKCSDLAFYLVTYQKNCDNYKVTVVSRSVVTNTRQSASIELPAANVENATFKFTSPVNKAYYIDQFEYKPEQEIEILSLTLDTKLMETVAKAASDCNSFNNPNCIYFNTITKKCDACAPGLLFYLNDCLQKCPDGTYANEAKTQCINCDLTKCRTCEKSEIRCTDCLSTQFWYLYRCFEKCPTGTFPVNPSGNNQAKECVICTDNCLACKDEKTCDICQTGYEHEGKCINSCPKGTFPQISPNRCITCPEFCETCSDLNKCTYCKDGTFLFEGKCSQLCPNGYWPNKDTRTCDSCIDNCAICENGETCKICLNGSHLHEGVCVSKCPIGTVSVSGVCTKCPQDCDICDANSPTQCLKCNSKTVRFEFQCKENCGDGYYPDAAGICQPCSSDCKICDENSCIQCNPNFYLLGKVCVNSCPDNYVAQGQTCVKCKDVNCKNCSAENNGKCEVCFNNFFLYQGKCETSCPEGTYPNVDQCIDCPDNCVTCKNSNDCGICKDGKPWLNKVCLDKCPDGYMSQPIDNALLGISRLECVKCLDSNCVNCSDNKSTCKVCKDDWFLYNGVCYNPCPITTYAVDKECKKCGNMCDKCLNAETCSKCTSPWVLGTDRKTCMEKCLDFESPDNNSECQKCNNNCLKCDIVNNAPNKCTDCELSKYFYKDECREKCIGGLFPDEEKRICLPCIKPCNECLSPDNCTSCEDGFGLFNKACTDKCPDKHVMINKVCKQCGPDCLKCSNKDVNFCNECLPPKVFLMNDTGVCYEKCPPKYFGLEKECLPCSTNCLECSAHNICNVCENGFYLFDNKCSESCPEGYIKNEGKCVKCENSCLTCLPDNLSSCQSCFDTKLLHKNTCVEKCPDGFWPGATECKPCQVQNCRLCDNKTDGKICDGCDNTPTFLYKNTCVPKCPPVTNTVVNEQACKDCTVLNCEVCNVKPDICDLCKDGFYAISNIECSNNCLPGFYKFERGCKKCFDKCNVCDDHTTCNECSNGSYLFIAKDGKQSCETDCPKTFVNNIQTKKCEPCNNNCDVCLLNKNCDSCSKGYYLQPDFTCLDTCPKGYFKDTNGKCTVCNKNCLACSSDSVCTECKDGFHLTPKKTCEDSCPNKYRSVEKICKPCQTLDDNCIKCDETLKKCVECQNAILFEGRCIDKCPPTYFKNNDGQCEKCLNNCNSCNDSKTCNECNEGYLLLNGNSCVLECPVKYFEIERRCQLCQMSDCLKCDSSNCLKCDENFHLFEGQCKTECPPGYFSDNFVCTKCFDDNCLTCTNSSNCTQCKAQLYILNGKTCVTDCPKFFTRYSDGTCKPCESGCDYCDERSPDICKECTLPNVLLPDGKCSLYCLAGYVVNHEKKNTCKKCVDNCSKCVSETNECLSCNTPMVVNHDKKSCVNKCEDGYVANLGICQPCKAENCATCNVDSEKCLTCIDKFLMTSEGKCVPKCPERFYPQNGFCQPCKNCQVCEDQTGICGECDKGFEKIPTGECSSKCQEGEFRDKETYQCKKCNVKDCSVCDISPDKCDKCKKDLNLLLDKECTSKCPDYYFSFLRGENDLICKPCIGDNTCKICKDDKECQECKSGYPLHPDKTCDKNCPVGYISIKNVCTKCQDDNCSVCDVNDLNKCVQCANGFFLKDGLCPSGCGKGYFVEDLGDLGKKCNRCKNNCIACSNTESCTQCDVTFVLMGNNCQNECDSGYVADNNNVCKPCKVELCSECNKEDQKICTKCQDQLLLKENKCVPDCGVGYVKNGLKCEKCTDLNCERCGPTADDCTLCKTSPLYYLLGSKCVTECPIGYTLNPNTNTCVKCNQADCAKCQYNTLDKCSKCISGKLLNGVCLENCPPKYLYCENKGECVECFTNCDVCSYFECKKCTFPFKLSPTNKTVCLSDCPDKHVNVNGECKACLVDNCSICPSNDLYSCEKCAKPFVMFEGRCDSTKCPIGFYELNGKCEYCSDYCASCTDNSTCKKCADKFYLHQNFCVDKCPDGFYAKNGECKECPQSSCRKCDAKSPAKCTECKIGYLYKDKCEDPCPSETFINGKLCSPCVQNCEICLDGKSCKKCKGNFLLHQGLCVEKCPVGWIDDNKLCKECGTNCATCLTSNLDSCQTCKQNFVLFGNTCIEKCPEKYFPENGICKKCDSTCLTCEKEGSCLTCLTNLKQHGDQCISDCPPGTANINNKCQNCSAKNCSTCNSDDLSECITCDKNFYLFEKLCTPTCPIGTFPNTNTKTCDYCSKNCAQCNKPEECKVCKDGFYFKEGDVSVCDLCKTPENLIIDEKYCKKCVAQRCTECLSNETSKCKICDNDLVLIDHQCQNECPTGFFKVGQECIACGKECDKCQDQFNCTKCSGDLVIFQGQCDKKCPDGYSPSTTRNNICEKCVDSNCLLCNGDQPKICIECNDKTVLADSVCHTECPAGYYLNGKKCEKCSNNCISCENDKKCTKCQPPKFLQEGVCVGECLTGYFTDDKKYECVKCDDKNCQRCDSSADICNLCDNKFFLLDGKCVNECPAGYFANPDKKCVKCPGTCKTCESSDKCLSCIDGHHLHKDQCTSKCPEKMTEKDGKCVDCSDKSCLECLPNLPEKCELCKDGTFLFEFTCIEKCPDGTYTDKENKKCVRCPDTCTACTFDKCTDCKESFNLHEGQCKPKCPDGMVGDAGKCKDCADPNCKVCLQNTTTCTKCTNGFLFQGYCIPQCPLGTFTVDQECKECASGCQSCDSANKCNDCKNSYYLDTNGQCVKKCPDGFFGDCVDHVCVKCSASCNGCFGITSSDCIACADNYVLHNEVCVEGSCPTGTYKTSIKGTDVCLDCPPTLTGCQECESPIKCKKCMKGYELKNNVCIEKQSIHVLIDKLGDISTPDNFDPNNLKASLLNALSDFDLSTTELSMNWFTTFLLPNDQKSDKVFWEISSVSNSQDCLSYKFAQSSSSKNVELIISHGESVLFTGALNQISLHSEEAIDNHVFNYFSISNDNKGSFEINYSSNNSNETKNFSLGDKSKKVSLLCQDSKFSYNLKQTTNVTYNLQNVIISTSIIGTDDQLAFRDNHESFSHAFEKNYISLANGISLTNSYKVSDVLGSEWRNYYTYDVSYVFSVFFNGVENGMNIFKWSYEYSNRDFIALNISYDNGALLIYDKNHAITLNKNKWYLFIIVQENGGCAKVSVISYDDGKRILDGATGNCNLSNVVSFYSDARYLVSKPGDQIYNLLIFIGKADVNSQEVTDYEKGVTDFINDTKGNNCLDLGQGLLCSKCDRLYKLVDGKCESQHLDLPVELYERYVSYNNNSKEVPVAQSLLSNSFTVTAFFRKKAHSIKPPTSPPFNILSYRSSADNKIYPLIREQLLDDYKSKFSAGQNSFDHDFKDEIYDYMFCYAIFEKGSNTVRVTVESKLKDQIVHGEVNYIPAISSVILADEFAVEQNNEFTFLNIYEKALTPSEIDKIKVNQPKDNNPGCRISNYKTGECATCAVASDGKGGCRTSLYGFKFSYIYGYNSFKSIGNLQNYVYDVQNQHTIDVNSLGYSVIGRFRIFNFQNLLKVDGKYSIFSVSNTPHLTEYIPDPSEQLIAMELRVNKGKSELVLIVNTAIEKNIITVQNCNLSDSWMQIYAGLNVDTNTFGYKILCSGSTPITMENIKIKGYAEKLQERSKLSTFGANINSDSNPYDLINGQFCHFYLIPNLGYSGDLYDKYFAISSFQCSNGATLQNCNYSIFDSNNNVSKCIGCKAGYNLMPGGNCEKSETVVFENVPFKVLDENLLQEPLKEYSLLNNVITSPTQVNFAFFFRLNFSLEGTSQIMLAKAGDLLIYLIDDNGLFYILVKAGTTQKALKTISTIYEWKNIFVSIQVGKIYISMKEAYSDQSTYIDNVRIDRTLTLPTSIILFNPYNQLQFFGLQLLRYNVGYPTIQPPKSLQCGMDCVSCDRGKCLASILGIQSDGKPRPNKVILPNAMIMSNAIPNYNRIKDFLPLNSFKLRSRSYTVDHVFSLDENNLSQLSLQGEFVEILGISNNSSVEKQTTYGVYLKFNYKNKKDFLITVSNGTLRQTVKPTTINASYNTEPLNKNHYVAISINESRLEYLFMNSHSNYVSGTVDLNGPTEYLTNNAVITFFWITLLSKPTTPVKLGEITYARISYENAIPLVFLQQAGQSAIRLIQPSCISGTRATCEKCVDTYSLLKQEDTSFCAYKPKGNIWFHKFGNFYLDKNYSTIDLYKGSNAVKNFVFTTRIHFSPHLNPVGLFQIIGDNSKVLFSVLAKGNQLIGSNGNSQNIVSLFINNDEFYMESILVLKYNLENGDSELYWYNTNTDRVASDVVPLKVDNSTGEHFSISVKFGWTSADATSNDFNFRASNPFLVINDTDITQKQAIELSPNPQTCSDPCKVDCSATNICAAKDRISEPLSLSLVDTTPSALQKTKLLRFLSDVDSSIQYLQDYSQYSFSLLISTKTLLESTYASNKGTLFMITPQVKQSYLTYKMTDVIPDSLQNTYSLSIINDNNQDLLLNVFNNDAQNVKRTGLLPVGSKVSSFTQIYLNVYVDTQKQLVVIQVIADNLVLNYNIKTTNSIAPLNRHSLIYTHPNLSIATINVNNPAQNVEGKKILQDELQDYCKLESCKICTANVLTGDLYCLKCKSESMSINTPECTSSTQNVNN